MAGQQIILDILIFVIVLDFCTAMFIPEKEYNHFHDANQYRNTIENTFNTANDGVDNSFSQIHVRPMEMPNSHSSYLTIRRYPNTGTFLVGAESIRDPFLTLPRKLTTANDDTDSKTTNRDTHSQQTNFQTSETLLKSFVPDFERYSGNTANSFNDIMQIREKSSDHRPERRVYGIEDFVNDFLKIVSKNSFKDGLKL